MGLFDKLFGRGNEKKAEQPVQKREQAGEVIDFSTLKLTLAELQNGEVQNGVHFGDNADAIKRKEPLPFNNEGVEHGMPWIIFSGQVSGCHTQKIYDFHQDNKQLFQVSCTIDAQRRDLAARIYSDYYSHLSKEFGEPVDREKMRIKMGAWTRSIRNSSFKKDFIGKTLSINSAITHFDTWIVPLDHSDVKIDLITLDQTNAAKGIFDLNLSYMLGPKGSFD